MSEQISRSELSLEPPAVDTRTAYFWMQDQNHGDNMPEKVTYDRGRGPEQFVVHDITVDSLDHNEHPGIDAKYAILKLSDEEGRELTVDAREYLSQIDFDQKAYQERLANKDKDWVGQGVLEKIERQAGYYHDIFKPLKRPDKAETTYDNTGKSFGQKDFDYYVNQDSRHDAAALFAQTLTKDTQLRHIIGSTADRIDMHDPLAVVDAIRTDGDLRFAVGVYYRCKVEWMLRQDGMFPYNRLDLDATGRFGAGLKMNHLNPNFEKNTQGLTIREKMPSADYVAVLCLAKLGGSFRTRDYDGKRITDLSDLPGEHRPAADLVIAS